MRMRGGFERLTWPLRRLVWKIEERLVWPLGDLLRPGPKTPAIEPSSAAQAAAPETIEIAPELVSGPTGWPASSASNVDPGAAVSKKFRTPFGGRIDASLREVAVVLGTVAVAIGVGVGAATLLGRSDDTTAGPSAGVRPAAARQVAAAPTASGPATLHGVNPNFKATADSPPAASATPTTDAQAAPLASTNSKPSAISPAADGAIAMKTARSFSGAFVLYEIGKTDAEVRKTFRSTATPALARALEDRPPRLPDSVDVPTAKVQNIVLGPEKGGQMDASVSLLRLGVISELRLTLVARNGAWAVSEVRG